MQLCNFSKRFNLPNRIAIKIHALILRKAAEYRANRGKDVLISAFAAADTEVLGPLRIKIKASNHMYHRI